MWLKSPDIEFSALQTVIEFRNHCHDANTDAADAATPCETNLALEAGCIQSVWHKFSRSFG